MKDLREVDSMQVDNEARNCVNMAADDLRPLFDIRQRMQHHGTVLSILHLGGVHRVLRERFFSGRYIRRSRCIWYFMSDRSKFPCSE